MLIRRANNDPPPGCQRYPDHSPVAGVPSTSPYNDYYTSCHDSTSHTKQCLTCDDIREHYRSKNWPFNAAYFPKCIWEACVSQQRPSEAPVVTPPTPAVTPSTPVVTPPGPGMLIRRANNDPPPGCQRYPDHSPVPGVPSTSPYHDYYTSCHDSTSHAKECLTCDEIRQHYRSKNWPFNEAHFPKCIWEVCVSQGAPVVTPPAPAVIPTVPEPAPVVTPPTPAVPVPVVTPPTPVVTPTVPEAVPVVTPPTPAVPARPMPPPTPVVPVVTPPPPTPAVTPTVPEPAPITPGGPALMPEVTPPAPPVPPPSRAGPATEGASEKTNGNVLFGFTFTNAQIAIGALVILFIILISST